jgi:hypothetical protein
MKPILGVYLGWIPPHGDTWEPLYRTIRLASGYQSDRTQLCALAIERYPGLKEPLDFHPDPLHLPYALMTRIPLNRPDYEYCAKLFNLPYPNLDILECIGRTGGLVSGDPFSTHPIVEMNDDGSYSYESVLWKFDPQVRDSLKETTQLEVSRRSNQIMIVTDDNRELGELLPHFSHIAEAMYNIKVVGIGDQHYFLGRQILISFDTTVNVSAKFQLEETTPEALVNV